MEETLKIEETSTYTIYHFPVITVSLIILNVLVFLFISLQTFYRPQTAENIFPCIKQEYPQCLEKATTKEYLECVRPYFLKKIASPEDCLYNIRLSCINNTEILNRCFPYNISAPLQFGFTPILFGNNQNLFSLLTSIFLHGGWQHLINNMICLLLIGSFVEIRLGNVRFLFLYLLSGICANLFFYFFNSSGTAPVIGASGAIFGLMGANLVLNFYKTNERLVPHLFGLDFLGLSSKYLALTFLLQIMYIIFSGETNIAFSAHIGGFLAGIILTLFLKKNTEKYTPEPLN